jgi:hypothetical protein
MLDTLNYFLQIRIENISSTLKYLLLAHCIFFSDCTKFYECYWDKWVEKFTLHIFPCPVAMAVRQYDESISACNWPFLGPNCEGNTII